ncbi:helix-turn-helix domain-containing protein [Trebonia kvetii]|uniref:helix-turn-helix domain-containing protein n=1 Tax=Trebonia kvetii TaxID=2480626 RepID=UPI001C9E89F0|nr:helix-turn-helix domain-containing protein [Trebonia kvetii]
MLRRLRAQARMDYRSLAAKAGFAASTLAAAAAGGSPPTLDVALAFGGACGAAGPDLDEIKRLRELAVSVDQESERTWRVRETARAVDRARARSTPKKKRPVSQPAPDPDGSSAQFMRQLRALRVWDGEPSSREIAHRAIRARSYEMPPSRTTISEALSPRRGHLPALSVVRAIVDACSGPVDDWTDAWRAIRLRELGYEGEGEGEAQLG